MLWMFAVLCDYIVSKPLINAGLIVTDVQQHLELLSGHLRSTSQVRHMVILIGF